MEQTRSDNIVNTSPREGRSTITPARKALTLDVALYRGMLDDPELTEDQKTEMLEALWSIMLAFVDLGYAVEPLEESCGQLPDMPGRESSAAQGAVSSDMAQTFQTSADRGRA